MEENATKKRLRRVARELFARNGYSATSIRMIASEADVNISAISEHFGGKKQLYNDCIQSSLNKVFEYYESNYQSMKDTIAKGEFTVEKAYEYLDTALDLQIEVAFNRKYDTTMALIYSENNSAAEDIGTSLSDAIFNAHEKHMAAILMRIAPISEEKAIIASRFINGSIISFGEHRSVYLKHIEHDPEHEYLAPQWVKDEIKEYCMTIVEHIRNES